MLGEWLYMKIYHVWLHGFYADCDGVLTDGSGKLVTTFVDMAKYCWYISSMTFRKYELSNVKKLNEEREQNHFQLLENTIIFKVQM